MLYRPNLMLYYSNILSRGSFPQPKNRLLGDSLNLISTFALFPLTFVRRLPSSKLIITLENRDYMALC